MSVILKYNQSEGGGLGYKYYELFASVEKPKSGERESEWRDNNRIHTFEAIIVAESSSHDSTSHLLQSEFIDRARSAAVGIGLGSNKSVSGWKRRRSTFDALFSGYFRVCIG
jgi:hypothetical protein